MTDRPRRRFLESLATTLLAIPVLAPLLVAVRTLLPRHGGNTKHRLPTLPLAAIPEDDVRRVTVEFERRQGAFVEQARHIVFLRREGESVVALSAECTHLGCFVAYDSERKRFVCPCHKGSFDIDGKNPEGPPRRPLTRYDAAVPADRTAAVTIEV